MALLDRSEPSTHEIDVIPGEFAEFARAQAEGDRDDGDVGQPEGNQRDRSRVALCGHLGQCSPERVAGALPPGLDEGDG